MAPTPTPPPVDRTVPCRNPKCGGRVLRHNSAWHLVVQGTDWRFVTGCDDLPEDEIYEEIEEYD